MTREFKPGDKVRLHPMIRIVKTAEQRGDPQWLTFENGSAGWSSNFEFIEPSVTHRELREVLEELTKTTLQNDFNAGWNDALDAFFTQATGEQP